MRTESYTEADQRAEALLDSILTKSHTHADVSGAIKVGNLWRELSNGKGWNPEPKNPSVPVREGAKAGIPTGVDVIAAERRRQVEEEGWTAEGDARYENGELARAGAAYALNAAGGWGDEAVETWPWSSKWWKPGAPLRDLAKAGALMAAEIDRRLADGRPL